jgi:hypothetical protein
MKTLFFAVIALLCGCSAIHSQEPVGLTPRDLSDEVNDWEGSWRNQDGIFHVFVLDATNGLIRTIGFERDHDEVKQETLDLHLRDTGDWTFASLVDENQDEPLHLWGRIKMEDGVCLAWAPDVEQFISRIADGTLPGTTNGTDGVLAPLTTNQYEIIMNEDAPLFEWDEPMIFWKIAD